MPDDIGRRTLLPCRSGAIEGLASGHCVVFSALDASVAEPIERDFARAGHLVVSNTKSHRMHEQVPLLVPEVNAEHVALAEHQRHNPDFAPGSILTNPNCSTIGLVLALKPLHDAFGVDRVSVVSLQAISGAGLPGVPSFEIVDNVIPLIGGEEEKMETEPLKILGTYSSEDGAIAPAQITVSAQANRVPVIDGHTLCVSVGLKSRATAAELISAWQGFESQPQSLALPSAPRPPIVYLGDDTAPQPRLHRDLGAGMAASVGRLRDCPLLDYRFVTLSHNTVRGAAGGAILVAELAIARGLMAET